MRLTIIATIFIPLSFIAGVWGMNFDAAKSPYNMPELQWRFGYPAAVATMLLIDVYLVYRFKKAKWM